MCRGRFTFGVGSGEALNEHIVGRPWPSTEVRLDMLAEAVEVIRALWSGGFVNHRGRHYTVDHARVYTRPEVPPPIYVSGFGPKSTALAARIGDGYINTTPDAELVRAFRDGGGGDKPVQGAFKACVADDTDRARRIAYERWPNSALPGELAQVLGSPRHLEQACRLVTPEAVVCGSDADRHLARFDAYARAGFDEVYVAHIGPHRDAFFQLYSDRVLPALRR